MAEDDPKSTDRLARLRDLLADHQQTLLRYVRSEARGLLRFESEEDVVQGINQRVLDSVAPFEHRSEEESRGWLLTVAARFVADRHDYWSALRRGSGRVLRLTFSGTGTSIPLSLKASQMGPSTVASRKEMLVLAAKALAVLPPRDQQLIRWMSEGVSLEEQARRLEIGYAACQRAGLRAQERFRKTFELAARATFTT